MLVFIATHEQSENHIISIIKNEDKFLTLIVETDNLKIRFLYLPIIIVRLS